MKMLFTQQEFESALSRQLLRLECQTCGTVFLKPKHRIQDEIKKNGLLYCSPNCASKARSARSKIHLPCNNCGKLFEKPKRELNPTNFCSRKCSGSFRKISQPNTVCSFCGIQFRKEQSKISQYNFCSRRCCASFKGHQSSKLVACDNCGKEILKPGSKIRSHKYHFCGKSCQAKYANRTYNRSARFGKNKSKAEVDLKGLILTDFPDLEIIENDRSTIPGGLEIDLFIPKRQIAIELNGPCHYIPIFGEAELTKTQDKDEKKLHFLQSAGIKFFVINIMGAGKNLRKILTEGYLKIKPHLLN